MMKYDRHDRQRVHVFLRESRGVELSMPILKWSHVTPFLCCVGLQAITYLHMKATGGSVPLIRSDEPIASTIDHGILSETRVIVYDY
jgi:hypothetical protein